MTYLKRFLKRPLRQYCFLSLKCYSDWQLGAIQIELTTLTPLITEDSAKQLVNSLQLTVICMIRLLSEGYVVLRWQERCGGRLWKVVKRNNRSEIYIFNWCSVQISCFI